MKYLDQAIPAYLRLIKPSLETRVSRTLLLIWLRAPARRFPSAQHLASGLEVSSFALPSAAFSCHLFVRLFTSIRLSTDKVRKSLSRQQYIRTVRLVIEKCPNGALRLNRKLSDDEEYVSKTLCKYCTLLGRMLSVLTMPLCKSSAFM